VWYGIGYPRLRTAVFSLESVCYCTRPALASPRMCGTLHLWETSQPLMCVDAGIVGAWYVSFVVSSPWVPATSEVCGMARTRGIPQMGDILCVYIVEKDV
jgi:hypothetical protein